MNNKFIIENNSSSFYTISDTLYDSNAIELTLKKYNERTPMNEEEVGNFMQKGRNFLGIKMIGSKENWGFY